MAWRCQRPWSQPANASSKSGFMKNEEEAEKLKNIERIDCNSCQVNTETLMKEGQKMKTKQNFIIALIALLVIAVISSYRVGEETGSPSSVPCRIDRNMGWWCRK
jgi:hypothetical protein